MTCNTWEHIWLNEGWATFLTPVWFEHRDGRAAYEARVRELFDGVIASDKGTLPDTPGMASKVYRDAWEPFRRSANPYGKGASVLAMLRARLGDEAFWRGVRLYVDRHKFKNVETSDFRQALEDGSGDSLELFFTQWVTRPNIPRLNIDAAWDEVARTLKLTGEQTQTINGLNPAFQFHLPVWIKPKGVSDWTKTTLTFDGKSAELPAITLDAEPEAIAFDPELTVIAEIRCTHPAASSLALLSEGPTLNARVQAMRGIGEEAPDSVLKALSDVAADRSLNVFLRVEAVRALARARSNADLSVLLTSATDAWQVREAVVSALADLSKSDNATATMRERSFVTFSKLAESDKSTRVRAAAIRGLGAMNAGGAIELLMRTSRTESQDDAIRLASIDALVALNRKSCLAVVGELTKPGRLSRTRAAAIRAVASLAQHDRDLAFELVSGNLADREWRSRQAAGESLVQLKDPRGLDALALRRKEIADPYEQALIDRWASDLKASLEPQPAR
jgi:aminopeptidase N